MLKRLPNIILGLIGSKLERVVKSNTLYKNNGITLMETIAVLAVVAILTGMMVPPIIKRIEETRRTSEKADLLTIIDALKTEIVRTRTIPGSNTWASFISPHLGLPVSSITKGRRLMVIDPNFRVGNPLAQLPYTQTTNGSLYPVSPRIMFLSVLSSGLTIPPDVLSDPVKFQIVWDTPDRAVPVGWGTQWNGKGEKLVIQRFELSSLFNRLIIRLENSSTAWISIDNSPPFSVTGFGLNRFYISGTVVSLYEKNGSSLFLREKLLTDTTYTFNGVNWDSRDIPSPESSSGLNNLAQIVDTILQDQYINADAKFGAVPKYLTTDLYYYMFIYTRWAYSGFDDFGSNSDQQVPENVDLQKLQKRIDDTSDNMIW